VGSARSNGAGSTGLTSEVLFLRTRSLMPEVSALTDFLPRPDNVEAASINCACAQARRSRKLKAPADRRPCCTQPRREGHRISHRAPLRVRNPPGSLGGDCGSPAEIASSAHSGAQRRTQSPRNDGHTRH